MKLQPAEATKFADQRVPAVSSVGRHQQERAENRVKS